MSTDGSSVFVPIVNSPLELVSGSETGEGGAASGEVVALDLATGKVVQQLAAGALDTRWLADGWQLLGLDATGRGDVTGLVEAYTRAQGMFREDGDTIPDFSERLVLDLDSIEPSLAGPRRPQDRVSLGCSCSWGAVTACMVYLARPPRSARWPGCWPRERDG